MKNIMYFRLKQGEEAAPLRDMALANFPNVNLHETDIQADDYGKKDVLNNIIRNIRAGKYEKLYIKSLSEISKNAVETLNLMNEIAEINSEFTIEIKGGVIIEPLELAERLNIAATNVIDEVDRDSEFQVGKSREHTDYLSVKIECDGKELMVDLPIYEDIIETELAKAGINLDEASGVKFTVDTSLPNKFKNIIERACEERGIFIANDISGVLLTYGMELEEEIMAIIEYTNADTTDKIVRIMYNTDGFKFIEGATSFENVGRYWVTDDMETEIESEIDKYMDYVALGRDIMKDYEGKFVEGGCVLNRDSVDIEKLFEMSDDIEEGMGGMQGM